MSIHCASCASSCDMERSVLRITSPAGHHGLHTPNWNILKLIILPLPTFSSSENVLISMSKTEFSHRFQMLILIIWHRTTGATRISSGTVALREPLQSSSIYFPQSPSQSMSCKCFVHPCRIVSTQQIFKVLPRYEHLILKATLIIIIIILITIIIIIIQNRHPKSSSPPSPCKIIKSSLALPFETIFQRQTILRLPRTWTGFRKASVASRSGARLKPG